MLRLQIESQPLLYELNSQPPQLRLSAEPPTLQLETEAATVEIQSGKGELQIDQTPCRYSVGRKNISALVGDYAQAGKAAASEAVVRIAQEGQRLADISSGVNAIAEIAKARSRPAQGKLSLVSLARPDISYVMKPVTYNPRPGQLHISASRGSITNDSQYGSVNMQITQYPSLSMWTIGNMDMKA